MFSFKATFPNIFRRTLKDKKNYDQHKNTVNKRIQYLKSQDSFKFEINLQNDELCKVIKLDPN